MSPSSARSLHDPEVSRRWVERLARFRSGRRTVAAFCVAEGVSESNFYLWRRRLASASTADPVAAVVPLRITSSPAAPIEAVLPSGTVMRFPADIGPELLVAILRGLEERPC